MPVGAGESSFCRDEDKRSIKKRDFHHRTAVVTKMMMKAAAWEAATAVAGSSNISKNKKRSKKTKSDKSGKAVSSSVSSKWGRYHLPRSCFAGATRLPIRDIAVVPPSSSTPSSIMCAAAHSSSESGSSGDDEGGGGKKRCRRSGWSRGRRCRGEGEEEKQQEKGRPRRRAATDRSHRQVGARKRCSVIATAVVAQEVAVWPAAQHGRRRCTSIILLYASTENYPGRSARARRAITAVTLLS